MELKDFCSPLPFTEQTNRHGSSHATSSLKKRAKIILKHLSTYSRTALSRAEILSIKNSRWGFLPLRKLRGRARQRDSRRRDDETRMEKLRESVKAMWGRTWPGGSEARIRTTEFSLKMSGCLSFSPLVASSSSGAQGSPANQLDRTRKAVAHFNSFLRV